MTILQIGVEFSANSVDSFLGYDYGLGKYVAKINGEVVAESGKEFKDFEWSRWDAVRDDLNIYLYVDNELILSATLPEDIYLIEPGETNSDGTPKTIKDCFNTEFTAPGCEFLMDNIVFADPDFDFANTRAGIIYDKISFNNNDYTDKNDGLFYGLNDIIAAIKYDKSATAGFKIEPYGRPFETVIELHEDRTLYIDSDYEAGSVYGYSQLAQDGVYGEFGAMYDFIDSCDLELSFDFYASDWCTDEALLGDGSAFIGGHINSNGVGNTYQPLGNGFIGYDFIKQAAVIGSISEQAGGYYGEGNTTFVPYEVNKDEWHNFSIQYKTERVDDVANGAIEEDYTNDFYIASIYIDGELIHSVKLDLWSIDADYFIFFPNFVKGYLDNLTVKVNGVVYDDAVDFTNGYSNKTNGMDFSGGKDWSVAAGGMPTHVYNETVIPASCMTDGWTNYNCSCGESSYSLYNIKATGHEWDEGVITTDPTASTAGIKTYTCTLCGETYTEEILGDHTHTWVTEELSATCTTDGYCKVYCSGCSEVQSDVTIPSTGHAIVTQEAKAATCTEIGWDAYQTCENCDYTTYVENPATGHLNTAIENATDATCTADGYTGDTVCTDCGETVVTGEVISKTGHIITDDSKVVTVPATCTTDGYTNTYCDSCGLLANTRLLSPATGHTWDGGVITTPSTDTADGVMTYTCTACGETKEETFVGHKHSWVTEETPATCTEDGHIKVYCSSCDEVQTDESISAKGHSPANDLSCIYVVLATCTQGGSITTLCPDCGEVVSLEETAPLNHMLDATTDAFGDAYIGKYPTVDSEGFYAKKCKLCGFEQECQAIEKLHDADFMVIDGVLIEYLGEGGEIKIPGNVTVIDESVFSGNTDITSVVVPASVTEIGKGAFAGMTATVVYLGSQTEWNSITKAEGFDADSTLTMVYSELRFTGASTTLENDLKINYKIEKSFFDEYGLENPYVIFEMNGETVTVSDYTVIGNHYTFSFCDISPKMMNDTINATLYATYDGVEYSGNANAYSVSAYCYNLLAVYNTDAHAEIRTLLVDMLNYGAASQVYTDYNVDSLANANLTATQASWGTSAERELVSVLDTAYATIEAPSVTWKGAGLVLGDSITMRFKLATDSIDGLSVKVVADGNEWIVTSDKLVEADGAYYAYFDKFTAVQMSEPVYVTVYSGDTAVSNTLSYSIESYAESMKDNGNSALADLLDAMMKYGDAAYAYAN